MNLTTTVRDESELDSLYAKPVPVTRSKGAAKDKPLSSFLSLDHQVLHNDATDRLQKDDAELA